MRHTNNLLVKSRLHALIDSHKKYGAQLESTHWSVVIATSLAVFAPWSSSMLNYPRDIIEVTLIPSTSDSRPG